MCHLKHIFHFKTKQTQSSSRPFLVPLRPLLVIRRSQPDPVSGLGTKNPKATPWGHHTA